ncbi:MAG: bacteriocin-protection protein, partial [Planctomycetes bacterium]|nr:bacteriocin-protection protein [Planctomycetota bacterium]
MTAKTFFASQAKFRLWLAKHHASVDELWIGFYKKASGRGGITYRQALDEALCYGWIDGVRKRVDDEHFVQRFTPRRPKSHWSDV